MGVGTANGLVALYDIRSNKPYFVKDHMEELPIKDIEFNNKQNIVFSMNKSILKLWDKNNVSFFEMCLSSLITVIFVHFGF